MIWTLTSCIIVFGSPILFTVYVLWLWGKMFADLGTTLYSVPSFRVPVDGTILSSPVILLQDVNLIETKIEMSPAMSADWGDAVLTAHSEHDSSRTANCSDAVLFAHSKHDTWHDMWHSECGTWHLPSLALSTDRGDTVLAARSERDTWHSDCDTWRQLSLALNIDHCDANLTALSECDASQQPCFWLGCCVKDHNMFSNSYCLNICQEAGSTKTGQWCNTFVIIQLI